MSYKAYHQAQLLSVAYTGTEEYEVLVGRSEVLREPKFMDCWCFLKPWITQGEYPYLEIRHCTG